MRHRNRPRKFNAAPAQTLKEVPLDASREARLLRAPDGAFRVDLYNRTTGRVIKSFQLNSATASELMRVVRLLGELRAALVAREKAGTQRTSILDEIRLYPDAHLIALARRENSPNVADAAAAAQDELNARIDQAAARLATLDNTNLRWEWIRALESTDDRAFTTRKAAETVGASRGAQSPDDLPSDAPPTKAEMSRAALVQEIEDTIQEGREEMQGARAFVREGNHFEELLPRGSHTNPHQLLGDLREMLAAARAALAYARSLPRKARPLEKERVQWMERLSRVYQEASDEFAPESFYGEITAREVLEGAPSEAEINALVDAGRPAEAELRVATAEARLAAARRGIDLKTMPAQVAHAPAGSLETFVRTERQVPFARRFGRPMPETHDTEESRIRARARKTMYDAQAEEREFNRLLAQAIEREAEARDLLDRVHPMSAYALSRRLPSVKYWTRRTKTLAELREAMGVIEAVIAEASALAATWKRPTLGTFADIVAWNKELPSHYNLSAKDFRDPVRIGRGSSEVTLTPAAVGALPIRRYLSSMWDATAIESVVKSAVDTAIKRAIKAGVPETRAIPVPIKTFGSDEVVNLVARVVDGEIVLDVPPRLWAGGADELRRRPTAYDRTRRYGLTNRPAGYGNVPAGYERVDPFLPATFPHDVVTYPKPLTRKDLYDFQMQPFWDSPEDAFAALLEDVRMSPAHVIQETRDAFETMKPSDPLAFGAQVVRDLANTAVDRTRVWPLGQYEPSQLAPLLMKMADIRVPELPFGAVPYDDEGRFFGSVVEVLPEGRVSPGWQGIVFNVRGKGTLIEVTHPSWDGRWTGDVPTVSISAGRLGRIVEWHDQKGERGTPFDPYQTRDFPESTVADQRVETWRHALHIDLRSAPKQPSAVVMYDAAGRLTVAVGTPEPGRLRAVYLERDAVLAGYEAVFGVAPPETVKRSITQSVTEHAGKFWRAATVKLPLVNDPTLYRKGATAAAQSVSKGLFDSGSGKGYKVTIAGPPFTDKGATFEQFRSLRQRAAAALVETGRSEDQAWWDAEAIENAILKGWWHDSFAPRPENKAIRQVFTAMTGQKLPASLKGTREIFNGERGFLLVRGS